ncbi:MAG: GTP 3',8-cyclase MoaA [Promethearchaeota archaeon]
MKDHCNRTIKHIRFSVTADCNYNCMYCDKEGFIPQTSLLSVQEITKLCDLLATILNVTKIKLTGGEPLCRKEIFQIIKNINDLHLYKDISMTTNGYLLDSKAKQLHEAGLNRINVSLCSLKPSVYEKITGSNSLDRVLKGLKTAQDVGLEPIKLNFVVLKGLNENEIEDMIDFCSKTGYILQLIELHKRAEAIGSELEIYEKNHVDVRPIIEDLESKAVKTLIRGEMQNRKVFTLPNNAIIETINNDHDSCKGCTKLRVGCDGNLFGCLFRSDLGRNVKEALNNHHTLSHYEELIKEVVYSRKPYYS